MKKECMHEIMIMVDARRRSADFPLLLLSLLVNNNNTSETHTIIYTEGQSAAGCRADRSLDPDDSAHNGASIIGYNNNKKGRIHHHTPDIIHPVNCTVSN